MTLLRQYVAYGLLVLLTGGLAGVVLLPAAPGWALWTPAALAAGVAVAVLDDFRRRRERALRQAAEAVRRLAAGKFGHRFYAGGSPALADLARATNAAAEALAEHVGRLETESRQLRAVLGGMVEGVVALDADQTVLFANDRAGQLLGFDALHSTGRRFWEVVRHRRLQEVVATGLGDPVPVREELDWPGRAGRRVALYVARLSGADEPRHSAPAILVIHDMTELRRLEQVRQEFVANVSHELKTPLSVIKVCAETLLAGAAADPAARDGFLAQINGQADRLHNLILDLLRLARIESHAEVLELGPVPLEAAISECLSRHQARALTKNLRLNVHPPTGSPVAALVDEEALGTILDNLVDNALKYTPAGGRIVVRWSASSGWACVEVEDTGVGIPERDQPRLFERFYRVDKARARELGGTGLGLSIVKHLAQAMGGAVGVRSAVGLGTTLTVKLPLAGC